jgi:Reverse transcriptase (RNA-dependent DNA polymerase)
MLVLSIICKLHTVQLDYTNLFAQVVLKEDVYTELPDGLLRLNLDKDIVLKLYKSLYGLVQAPKTFYNHLATTLKKDGFECYVTIDICLWINKQKGVICVIWVDDCLCCVLMICYIRMEFYQKYSIILYYPIVYSLPLIAILHYTTIHVS